MGWREAEPSQIQDTLRLLDSKDAQLFAVLGIPDQSSPSQLHPACSSQRTVCTWRFRSGEMGETWLCANHTLMVAAAVAVN